MLAKNIAHQALIAGHTVLCTVAGQLLGDLTASESDAAVRRRLRQYSAPDVLVVDEIGYLSYSNRHADLLFELLNRRYEKKSTIITTNKPFAQWQEVFPSAGCVVSLVDRLVHRSEVIAIEGKSYRLKEAEERSERDQRRRRTPKAPDPTSPATAGRPAPLGGPPASLRPRAESGAGVALGASVPVLTPRLRPFPDRALARSGAAARPRPSPRAACRPARCS